MNRGKYIVLEGPQGVGKTTQIQILAARLKSAGLSVRILREPDSQSHLTSRAIRQITQDPNYPLNSKAEVLLFNASRALSLDVIKQSVESGIICLVDRSFLSTLVMQFYGRGDIEDYSAIENIITFAVGDNHPDLTIVLDAPAQTIQERTRNRGIGERYDRLDIDFIERCRTGYLLEAKKRGFPVVFVTKTIEEVTEEIWQIVTKVLAQRTAFKKEHPATSIGDILRSGPKTASLQVTQPIELDKVSHATDEQYLERDSDSNYIITTAGRNLLEDAVTNVDDNVYAFTNKFSSQTVAAAMARLSRRGDDMRVTLLYEFTNNQGSDEQLLKRVITAYGDDSVQQLVGLHIVVENASNLLTKKLEWGRLAAYLEQSTRYIYFDQKDVSGNYKYHIPEYLNDDIKALYKSTMDTIFDTY